MFGIVMHVFLLMILLPHFDFKIFSLFLHFLITAALYKNRFCTYLIQFSKCIALTHMVAHSLTSATFNAISHKVQTIHIHSLIDKFCFLWRAWGQFHKHLFLRSMQNNVLLYAQLLRNFLRHTSTAQSKKWIAPNFKTI